MYGSKTMSRLGPHHEKGFRRIIGIAREHCGTGAVSLKLLRRLQSEIVSPVLTLNELLVALEEHGRVRKVVLAEGVAYEVYAEAAFREQSARVMPQQHDVVPAQDGALADDDTYMRRSFALTALVYLGELSGFHRADIVMRHREFGGEIDITVPAENSEEGKIADKPIKGFEGDLARQLDNVDIVLTKDPVGDSWGRRAFDEHIAQAVMRGDVRVVNGEYVLVLTSASTPEVEELRCYLLGLLGLFGAALLHDEGVPLRQLPAFINYGARYYKQPEAFLDRSVAQLGLFDLLPSRSNPVAIRCKPDILGKMGFGAPRVEVSDPGSAPAEQGGEASGTAAAAEEPAWSAAGIDFTDVAAQIFARLRQPQFKTATLKQFIGHHWFPVRRVQDIPEFLAAWLECSGKLTHARLQEQGNRWSFHPVPPRGHELVAEEEAEKERQLAALLARRHKAIAKAEAQKPAKAKKRKAPRASTAPAAHPAQTRSPLPQRMPLAVARPAKDVVGESDELAMSQLLEDGDWKPDSFEERSVLHRERRTRQNRQNEQFRERVDFAYELLEGNPFTASQLVEKLRELADKPHPFTHPSGLVWAVRRFVIDLSAQRILDPSENELWKPGADRVYRWRPHRVRFDVRARVALKLTADAALLAEAEDDQGQECEAAAVPPVIVVQSEERFLDEPTTPEVPEPPRMNDQFAAIAVQMLCECVDGLDSALASDLLGQALAELEQSQPA